MLESTHEGNRIPALLGVQRRRDKQPHLPEDQRGRDEQARNDGNADVQHERFGRVRVDHRLARPERLPQGQHYERIDVFDEERGNGDARAQRKERADDALPELIEVLQKRHLPAALGIVVVEPAVGHVAR